MNQDEQERLIRAEQEIAELNDLLLLTKQSLNAGVTKQGKELTPTNVTDLMKLQYRSIEARAKLRGAWPIGLEGGYSE